MASMPAKAPSAMIFRSSSPSVIVIVETSAESPIIPSTISSAIAPTVSPTVPSAIAGVEPAHAATVSWADDVVAVAIAGCPVVRIGSYDGVGMAIVRSDYNIKYNVPPPPMH